MRVRDKNGMMEVFTSDGWEPMNCDSMRRAAEVDYSEPGPLRLEIADRYRDEDGCPTGYTWRNDGK